ncbi:hypothetical protein ACQ1ZK_20500 [Enterococcus faecium]
MSIALPKQKHLRGPLLDYLRIAEENGDLFAWKSVRSHVGLCAN